MKESLERKAQLYNQLLDEYDRKMIELRHFENKIDPSKDDSKKINELKKEISEIHKKAISLGSI